MKKKKRVVSFKLDLKKDFDNIKEEFLISFSVEFGYPHITIYLIVNIITFSSLFIL